MDRRCMMIVLVQAQHLRRSSSVNKQCGFIPNRLSRSIGPTSYGERTASLCCSTRGRVLPVEYRTAHVPTDYEHVIYVGMALLSHVAGMVALFLQVQLKPDEPRSRMWSLPGALQDEITPSAPQPQATLRFRKESPLFLLMQWLVSSSTIVYTIFGTFRFPTTQLLVMD